MAGRRTSRRVSSVQQMREVDEFVSGDQFDFSQGEASLVGPQTRARRSSIYIAKPTQNPRERKRMLLMPTVKEGKPASNRAAAPAASGRPTAFKATSASATGKTAAAKVTVKAQKATAVQAKVSKDLATRGKLDSKVAAKPKGIEVKNFYVSPAVKRTNLVPPQSRRKAGRNLTDFAVSPTKVARKSFLSDSDILNSLDDMFDKTPLDGHKPPKTFATEAPEKVKPRRATLLLQSPIVAVSKELLKAKKLPKYKEEADSPALKPRQTQAKSEKVKKVKTPARKSRQTPVKLKTPAREEQNTAVGALLSDMKEVTVMLSQIKPKIKVDPETLMQHLKLETSSPVRVKKVVEKILETKAKSSRKRKGADTDAGTPSKKRRLDATLPTPPVQAKSTPVSRKSIYKQSPAATKKTPASVLKKTPKEAKSTPVSLKTAAVSSPKLTPAENKTPRLRSIPRKTPGPRGSAANAAKKTPAMRKVSAKLVSTPVQENPANLLKKNLRMKVETAIVTKIAQKPNSSPYILAEKDNSSPVFEKVSERREVKIHLTGTPAQRRPGRKFGTVLQPSLLVLNSPVPLTQRRSVRSSTPIRGKELVHPTVEATPIRAPSADEVDCPVSPAPEMVTGGLAKMCVIM